MSQQKKFLSSLIKVPLRNLSHEACQLWDQPSQLTQRLHHDLCKLPHCQLLYAIDINGRQISSNVTRNGTDEKWLHQDLSQRPYFCDNLPFRGMVLSAVYLSQRSMQPCITALQAVTDKNQLLGFIAADFHVKDIPITNTTTLYRIQHQLKQSGRTAQRRTKTDIDENIDYLIVVLSTLMQEHGIFQSQIYFDNGLCSLSSFDDPCRYQLFNVRELMDPEMLDLYNKADYNEHASVAAERIPEIFAQFKVLRQLDDDTYIRSGSLNIINGQISINLSHDGAHFMNYDKFLNSDLTHWLEPDNLSDTQPIQITTPN